MPAKKDDPLDRPIDDVQVIAVAFAALAAAFFLMIWMSAVAGRSNHEYHQLPTEQKGTQHNATSSHA